MPHSESGEAALHTACDLKSHRRKRRVGPLSAAGLRFHWKRSPAADTNLAPAADDAEPLDGAGLEHHEADCLAQQQQPTTHRRENSLNARPGHGTRGCYLRGCRHEACRTANSRYLTRYRLDRHRGTLRRVPVAPVRDHVQTLYRAGWTTTQIATAANCQATSVSRVLRNVTHTIRADLAARLLSAAPTIATCTPTTVVSSLGTSRRVRALMAIGHTQASIASELGMSHTALGLSVKGTRDVTAATATAIARLYDKWAETPGPSQRARNLAAANGWAAPVYWDEDTIEDPEFVPSTTEVHGRAAAALVAEDIRHLGSFGISECEIATRVGRSPSYVREQLAGRRGPGWRQESQGVGDGASNAGQQHLVPAVG